MLLLFWGELASGLLSGIGGGLMGGSQQQNQWKFDPKNANSQRQWLVNNQYYKDLEANMGEWDTSRAGQLGQGQNLYNMALSQAPVSANTGALRRVAGQLTSEGFYDPYRQAIGTAQDYRDQAARGGLPGQMLANRQAQEAAKRRKGMLGNPAQEMFINNQLAQQNSLNAANSRDLAYATGTENLMKAQQELGGARIEGYGRGMQGYGQAAGLELNADQLNQQKFMMLSSLLGQNTALALMQNPWLMEKFSTDKGIAMGPYNQQSTNGGQNWGQFALGAGLSAIGTGIGNRGSSSSNPYANSNWNQDPIRVTF